MRNRNFTAHLRTRRLGIHLDASLNMLGFKISGRRKAKGEQAVLENRLFPYVEEMGERPDHGTGLASPNKEEKSTIQII